jgi:hypothetical protein
LTDSVVADFSKIGTIHIKIGIDQTKIDTVHPKFDKKYQNQPDLIFSTCQIFKHRPCCTNDGSVNVLVMCDESSGRRPRPMDQSGQSKTWCQMQSRGDSLMEEEGMRARGGKEIKCS